jgi:hypothetical protein
VEGSLKIIFSHLLKPKPALHIFNHALSHARTWTQKGGHEVEKYLKRSDELEAQWQRLEKRHITLADRGFYAAMTRIIDQQNQVLDQMDRSER